MTQVTSLTSYQRSTFTPPSRRVRRVNMINERKLEELKMQRTGALIMTYIGGLGILGGMGIGITGIIGLAAWDNSWIVSVGGTIGASISILICVSGLITYLIATNNINRLRATF